MTCLLRNLYEGQEATVRTGHGTTDWFQTGKGVVKAMCYHTVYLIYMESASWENSGLDEAQAGIKIARRNINNLRYADDTTLMAKSEEELKSLLMKEKKESEKVGLKLSIQKLRSWHLVPTLHGKEMGKQWQILFCGALKSLQIVTAAMKLKDACSLEEKLWPI